MALSRKVVKDIFMEFETRDDGEVSMLPDVASEVEWNVSKKDCIAIRDAMDYIREDDNNPYDKVAVMDPTTGEIQEMSFDLIGTESVNYIDPSNPGLGFLFVTEDGDVEFRFDELDVDINTIIYKVKQKLRESPLVFQDFDVRKAVYTGRKIEIDIDVDPSMFKDYMTIYSEIKGLKEQIPGLKGYLIGLTIKTRRRYDSVD